MTKATAERESVSVPLRERVSRLEQGYLVLVLAVAVAIIGALTTSGFLSGANVGNMLRLSAAFGILAVGQSIVVLGKGLDLSGAAVALGCGQATLAFIEGGMSEEQAIVFATMIAVSVGLINGVLVAYVEVPALFATLATGLFTIGVINVLFLDQNFYNVAEDSIIAGIARGSVLGVPRAVLVAAVVFVFAWLLIRYTIPGRLVRAMGDNYETARFSGAPVRPLQVFSYVVAALLALLAGYMTVSIQGSAQTAVNAFDPLLFTALTVTVIGGVSLAGGRGSIFGVLAGAIFVGEASNETYSPRDG